MSCFLQEISFHGIDLSQIFDDNIIMQEVSNLMQTFMQNGIIKPLPKTVFSMDEAEKAFRYLFI